MNRKMKRLRLRKLEAVREDLVIDRTYFFITQCLTVVGDLTLANALKWVYCSLKIAKDFCKSRRAYTSNL